MTTTFIFIGLLLKFGSLWKIQLFVLVLFWYSNKGKAPPAYSSHGCKNINFIHYFWDHASLCTQHEVWVTIRRKSLTTLGNTVKQLVWTPHTRSVYKSLCYVWLHITTRMILHYQAVLSYMHQHIMLFVEVTQHNPITVLTNRKGES